MSKQIISAAILTILLFLACEKNETTPVSGDINFRQEMRQLVQSISAYGHYLHPEFIIIPHNGEGIITVDGLPEGPIATGYVNAIDGIGRDELFFGYNDEYNKPTPPSETSQMLPFLNLLQQNGKAILVTDYTGDEAQRKEASTQCQNRGFIPFVTSDRQLSEIPNSTLQPALSGKNISRLSEAESFLFLIQPEKFNAKSEYLATLAQSTYDLLLIDLFFENQQQPLSAEDLQLLKIKPDGTQRLLIAYMNIGEAQSNRYYWHEDWHTAQPYWMETENSNVEGNFSIRYWERDWKDILIGNKDSYLKKIVDAGFDGVYLDAVDAHTIFE